MLSLHSSFAHDVKFYASDEGRVQMTAAVFARSFLELDEEEIIPILYALVWNDKRANMLLEHSSSDSTAMMAAKRQLAVILNSDVDFSESNKELDPTQLFDGVTVEELRKLGLGKIGNPYRKLQQLRTSITQLCIKLKSHSGAHSSSPLSLRRSPPIAVAVSRLSPLSKITKVWAGLLKAFYNEKTYKFDISKIPDIADVALFDLLHHPYM